MMRGAGLEFAMQGSGMRKHQLYAGKLDLHMERQPHKGKFYGGKYIVSNLNGYSLYGKVSVVD